MQELVQSDMQSEIMSPMQSKRQSAAESPTSLAAALRSLALQPMDPVATPTSRSIAPIWAQAKRGVDAAGKIVIGGRLERRSAADAARTPTLMIWENVSGPQKGE